MRIILASICAIGAAVLVGYEAGLRLGVATFLALAAIIVTLRDEDSDSGQV